MTLQEIFDTALNGIRKQGKPSYLFTNRPSFNPDKPDQNEWVPVCHYRLGDCKCAIGHLITDEAYQKYYPLENLPVPQARVLAALRESGLDILDGTIHYKSVLFLTSLQAAHDIPIANATRDKHGYTTHILDLVKYFAFFELEMMKLANEYNLQYTDKDVSET